MHSIKTDDDALNESMTKDEECLTEGTASKVSHRGGAAKVMGGKNARDMNGVDSYPCLA